MKNFISIAAAFAITGSALAADSAKDTVKNAAGKLAAAENYSWVTTIVSSQFQPGPSHGKTEKGGFTYVDYTFQDNKLETYVKDGKGAIKGDGNWKSLGEALKDEGDGNGFNMMRFMAMRMQDYKTPAVEAGDIAGNAKELTQADDAFSGELNEEGAKSLFPFRGRDGQGPTISNAKGSVKFWIKDGVLTKYQFRLQGSVNFGGDDRDIDRTTTVEIKDVGATKVVIPDDAKAKTS